MAASIQKYHVAQWLGYAILILSGSGVLQVVAILEQTRSSYLATFLSLRKAIQQEAVVAEDNLKFLQCLEQPCRTLASATAKVHRLYTDTKFQSLHIALSSHTCLILLQRAVQMVGGSMTILLLHAACTV